MRKWSAPRFDAGACTMLKSIKFLIMEMYGKIRCVTFPELVSQGRILSKPNYDKKVREGKIRVVRPGKGAGSYALIDYTLSLIHI